MSEAKNLEQTIEEETKKPGFFRRNIKKIVLIGGLTIGATVLTGAIALSYFILKKDGKTIKGDIDGKIDKEYYQTLALEDKDIKEISQIEDLIAEIYYLNTGNKIEDKFRFTFIDKDKETLKYKLIKLFKKGEIIGANSGNGDTYINNEGTNGFFNKLHVILHELGHGRGESFADITSNIVDNYFHNTEPIAEKNVIDSMVALMYLDPELGHDFYSAYVNRLKDSNLILKTNNDYQTAFGLNILRCMKEGNLEINEVYRSNKIINELIKEKAKENPNYIIDCMEKGILAMFKKRFKDKADFEVKYKKLKQYF
ncbi:hypothetical protein KY332_04630 [Candidatus Woesearchaeota archaeon]|nr:hypothetical protein [Candidatus Woesearchaeota archaeon]